MQLLDVRNITHIRNILVFWDEVHLILVLLHFIAAAPNDPVAKSTKLFIGCNHSCILNLSFRQKLESNCLKFDPQKTGIRLLVATYSTRCKLLTYRSCCNRHFSILFYLLLSSFGSFCSDFFVSIKFSNFSISFLFVMKTAKKKAKT